jgi:peptidoglycan/LPS O-acetylase OafA/YrhL
VAVTLVVVFHLRPDLVPGGWVGMSVFFPLSGFLITRLLLAELGRERQISLRQFWSRRARRLLPALYALLACVGIVLVINGMWTATEQGATWSSVLYVNNWWQLHGATDYWAQFGAPSAFEHLWSLSVEEQFYIVWPLLVCAAARWARRPLETILRMCVVLAGAGVLYGLAISRAGWGGMTDQYYNSVVRSAELLAGSALAAWLAARPDRVASDRNRPLLGVVACGLLVVLCGLALTLDGTSEQFVADGGMFLSGLATVVIILSALGRGPVTTVLSWAPLRWMGTRCYSLYLWHWPIIVLVTTTNTGLRGWSLTFLRTALIGAAVVLSYWLVEERFRRRRRPAWAHAARRA